MDNYPHSADCLHCVILRQVDLRLNQGHKADDLISEIMSALATIVAASNPSVTQVAEIADSARLCLMQAVTMRLNARTLLRGSQRNLA